MAQRSPQKKKKDRNYSRVPRRWLHFFPSGIKLLVLFAALILVFGFVALLQESDVRCCRCCRRRSDGSRVHAFRLWRRNVSPLVRSHANEQITVSDGSSLFPRPLVRGTLLCGRFKTRTNRWWFELASLWVHPPLIVLQLDTYIWRRFGSLRAEATVRYGINRRNSHLRLCRLATSLFHVPLDHGKFLIREFPFESVNKFHRLLPRPSLSRY